MSQLGEPEIVSIEKLVQSFIWEGRPSKVKQAAMILDYQEGGLKLPDIRIIIKSQRIMWIKRYFDSSSDHPWKKVFEWQLSKVGGVDILQNSNIDLKALTNAGLMPFYYDIIVSWCQLNKGELKKKRKCVEAKLIL